MPVYQPNIPTGTVNLDVDYLNLQGNFDQANIVYGTDHYPFDNATPNQGFHNVVTTPPFVDNPPTGLPPVTAANPKFYAFQAYPALGVLHFSRGPNNAVPCPVTFLNSPSTPIVLNALASTNVLDFTGFSFAMCVLQAMSDTATTDKTTVSQQIRWSQNNFNTFAAPTSSLGVTRTGNILQLVNLGGAPLNVYWTLQIIRIQ